MLRDELGIDAPQRLKALERLILRQDGSLDLDRPRPRRADARARPPAGGDAPEEAAEGSIEFGILGSLEVRAAGRTVPLGGTRRRAVLALLLLEANRVVAVDRLVDGVWGDDPPASAQASLQNHLVRLVASSATSSSPERRVRARGRARRARPRPVPAAGRGGARRRSGNPAARLREALALWRGSRSRTSPGSRRAAAAHLDELRLSALEDRIDADLQLGRHPELVPELEALVAGEPYREQLRRQLIVALYRSGRQAAHRPPMRTPAAR